MKHGVRAIVTQSASATTETAPLPPASSASIPYESPLPLIEKSLDDDQAEDIVVINLEGKSALADALIIASGRNGRHIAAMADHLRDKLKDAGYGESSIEGVPQCDWVLLDAGDVVVHLFRPEVRAFYNIEKMWGVEGPKYAAPVDPFMMVDL